MVVQGHPYRLCCLSKFSSNGAVELCRRGIPTDMVMYCNNVCRIVEPPESHDVSRVGSLFRNFTSAGSDSSEQFMFRIEEGFGLTAVEIMSAGKPIIATDVDGLKQVVEGTGELFPVGDLNALTKIIKCLLRDEARYEMMKKLSVKRAAKYDISQTANQYIATYKEIFNE